MFTLKPAVLPLVLLLISLPLVRVQAQNAFNTLPGPAANADIVGDPANPSDLGKEINDAYSSGARYIVIKPGVYFLDAPDSAQILLSHWKDAVISAYRSILIFDNNSKAGHLFLLDTCHDVTIEGPVLSQTEQTAYQGRVIAIGKDDSGNNTCDWRPSAGYPVPTPDITSMWINFVDDKSRTINLRAGDYYDAKVKSLGDGSFQFQLGNRPVQFQVGDWLVSRYGNPPGKVGLTGCENCTIKDVTMMRNGFAPIFDGEGGNNHYLSDHWALGPRPSGATDDPIVTNAADGIHSPDDWMGPDIEDCTFDGVFLDDCIAIHGGFHGIKSVNGPVIVAENGYAFYEVGDPVRISDDRGFYLQANITALTDNHDGTSTLTLATDQTIPLDAKLSDPLHDGEGYKIINCRLGNTRSRGIIVKSDNGLIRGNIITHCGLAIRIGPEWGSEADYSQNVEVDGNRVEQNGDGIVIDGSGVKENRNITIENNQLVENTGNPLSISWADGVTVTGNSFAPPPIWPDGDSPRPAVKIWSADDVHISGNRIVDPTGFAQPLLNAGGSNAGLEQDINPQ